MNLPNKITLSRIILLPAFLAVGLINFPYNNFVALSLFIILALTDFLDGYIARKYNLVTNTGKFLDTIADKLLCTTGLLLLIVGSNPIIPNPYGIISVFLVLLRDYAVTGLRQIAQLKGVIIAADKLGKIKANFQYVMIVWGFLIGGLNAIESVANTEFLTYFNYVYYGFVAITTILVLVSGIMYLVKNGYVFKEDNESNATSSKEEKNDSDKTKTTTKTNTLKSNKNTTNKTKSVKKTK